MNCPPRVRGALNGVEGVHVKSVDYDKKTVSLMVEPTTDPKALFAALEKAGYGGSVKK